MDIVNDNYYKGFEGEPEIQFIRVANDGQKYILKIWDGYFVTIMDSMIPAGEEWTGIAYFYSMHEGWYEESPWQIPNINDALTQFRNVDFNNLNQDEKEKLNNIIIMVPKVLADIIQLLKKAKELNEIVFIAYE